MKTDPELIAQRRKAFLALNLYVETGLLAVGTGKITKAEWRAVKKTVELLTMLGNLK